MFEFRKLFPHLPACRCLIASRFLLWPLLGANSRVGTACGFGGSCLGSKSRWSITMPPGTVLTTAPCPYMCCSFWYCL